ncbi:polysaccharide pyruvyl transferase family protein [Epilithonimonas zeae]|uniref:polysaccharide pyruvyl transferase family protein n=1 Tax=Epilithonimonas zeae TaxID=1416779 RepID=UPI00200C4824|nr:polysaccharide pyruvyl transferase family protein [Epilithonimonas zeae]UQB67454.1 polysaccharide pyruvyl transferase family protein [Epilithonimonas zeae]
MKADNINYKKVAILGPHDRMNYGDLLFPIMLDFAISKKANKEITLSKYSIVNSDLTDKGAFASKNYKKLISDINNNKINIIIIAGGESLGATWARLYSFINPIYSIIYEKTPFATSKYIYPIIKKILGANSEFPFFINKKDFKQDVKVIYNSVGGVNYINNVERIEDADYFAVRDSNGYAKIKNLSKKVYNYPDSAIIMSDIFSKDRLKKKLTEKNQLFTNYIFFQISEFKIQNEVSKTIEELFKILSNTNYNIVLCPIGTAKGHEDHIILNKIYLELKKTFENRLTLIIQPSVEVIMGLIAFSQMYIGTSLHGVITAMSFGVKYMGLNPKQTKVYNYIDTWSNLNVDHLIAPTYDFYKNFVNIIGEEDLSKLILESAVKQKEKYYESVDNIISIIGE